MEITALRYCPNQGSSLKDEDIEDSDNLPEPDVLAADITENLGTALGLFERVEEELEPWTPAREARRWCRIGRKGSLMDLSLKPHPLVAHWVPGFVVCLFLALSYFGWHYHAFVQAVSGGGATAMSLLIVTVLAFVVGEVIDCIRDLGEDCIDRWKKVKAYWDFFFWSNDPERENLEQGYFTWYVFNVNLSVGLAIALVLVWLAHALQACGVPIGMERVNGRLGAVSLAVVLSATVLFKDAMGLRVEVLRLMQEWKDSKGEKKRETV